MVTLTGQYLQGDTDIALGGLASRIELKRHWQVSLAALRG
jgi:hypothetical protein